MSHVGDFLFWTAPESTANIACARIREAVKAVNNTVNKPVKW